MEVELELLVFSDVPLEVDDVKLEDVPELTPLLVDVLELFETLLDVLEFVPLSFPL